MLKNTYVSSYYFDGITMQRYNVWNRASWPPGAFEVPISGDPSTIDGQQIEVHVDVLGEEVILQDGDWVMSCPHATLKVTKHFTPPTMEEKS